MSEPASDNKVTVGLGERAYDIHVGDGMLKALGITTPVSIPEDDYTEIFAVLFGDTPQLLRLHYPF